MINVINVRVYAACVKDNKLLVLFEEYAGEHLIKLPGGGLEFGEGVIDCLHREFAEELNIRICNIRHLYTQEDFVASRFRAHEQLLTIYYLVDIEDEHNLEIMCPGIKKTEWVSLDEENPFVLPVDKIVYRLLQEKFQS